MIYPLPAVSAFEGMETFRQLVAYCEAVREELGSTAVFAQLGEFHVRWDHIGIEKFGRVQPGLAHQATSSIKTATLATDSSPSFGPGTASAARRFRATVPRVTEFARELVREHPSAWHGSQSLHLDW